MKVLLLLGLLGISSCCTTPKPKLVQKIVQTRIPVPIVLPCKKHPVRITLPRELLEELVEDGTSKDVVFFHTTEHGNTIQVGTREVVGDGYIKIVFDFTVNPE